MPKNLTTKLLSFIFLIIVSTSLVQATPQSDYNYQLTQYRKHNVEFQALKEDNQKNPTLDNQQKALQAAKQTIISRDTAKIAYIELLLSSIREQKLNDNHIKETENKLILAKQFYISQLNLAKNIVSIEDLTIFTVEYLELQKNHQNQIIKAQVTRKLAILIRLQVNIKDAYDSLLPKLDDNTSNPVTAGISRISILSDKINQLLQSQTISIKESEVTNYSKTNFFSKQTERMTEINNLQIELVNTLVDLETNYAN